VDAVGPFDDEGVTFLHSHPGILHKHLWAFAASLAHNTHTDYVERSFESVFLAKRISHVMIQIHSFRPALHERRFTRESGESAIAAVVMF